MGRPGRRQLLRQDQACIGVTTQIWQCHAVDLPM